MTICKEELKTHLKEIKEMINQQKELLKWVTISDYREELLESIEHWERELKELEQ